MTRTRDIEIGNELWTFIITLYNEGVSYQQIANNPRVNKHRTTILFHIKNYERKQANLPDLPRRVYTPIIVSEDEAERRARLSAGRCKQCGIIKSTLPTHNCKPGSYYTPKLPPHDLYGNGVN